MKIFKHNFPSQKLFQKKRTMRKEKARGFLIELNAFIVYLTQGPSNPLGPVDFDDKPFRFLLIVMYINTIIRVKCHKIPRERFATEMFLSN